MQVRESQIEDVLATYPYTTQRILGRQEELTLLSRQMSLEKGKLDLLFASGSQLLLLELKVETFRQEFIQQVQEYREGLLSLQRQGMLLAGNIEAFLLCPRFPDDALRLCREHDIVPVEYSPEYVLEAFFSQVKASSPFMTVKPMDSGLWNIHLVNRVLYALSDCKSVVEISAKTGLSVRSVGNHLRFAMQLCLVTREGRSFVLSDLGKQYVFNRDFSLPVDAISEAQSNLLRDFIVKDPFVSPTVFGIYQMIETVFALSRDTYPVPLDLVIPYFRDACGKRFEWQTDKSAYHGTRMYSNYAIELGLLAKVGQRLLLTPNGLHFILLLQLHKGIRIIDALQTGQ